MAERGVALVRRFVRQSWIEAPLRWHRLAGHFQRWAWSTNGTSNKVRGRDVRQNQRAINKFFGLSGGLHARFTRAATAEMASSPPPQLGFRRPAETERKKRFFHFEPVAGPT